MPVIDLVVLNDTAEGARIRRRLQGPKSWAQRTAELPSSHFMVALR